MDMLQMVLKITGSIPLLRMKYLQNDICILENSHVIKLANLVSELVNPK